MGYFFVPGPLGGLKSVSGDVFGHTRFWVKNDQNLQVGLFDSFISLGISEFPKTPWESFLSANNALTKKFLFSSHPDFICCGLLSQGTFSDTLIRLEASKRIFLFRSKVKFFPRGKSRVFG